MALAALSVRAVARDVGMVSSAVYRYFPSRDDLITELLVICYTELAEEVEAAETEVTDRSDRLGRWLAIARTLRRWAVAHPYDYALLYGSPVPGYAAPRRTVEPAARIPRLVIALVSENDAVPAPRPPEPTATGCTMPCGASGSSPGSTSTTKGRCGGCRPGPA